MKRSADLRLSLRLLPVVVLLLAFPANGTILWSDFGPVLAHDTGAGQDILHGAIKRDESSTNTLYFKFHVDPLSDLNTEPYCAGFQLFQGSTARLGIGNAWVAWAYSAFNTSESGTQKQTPGEFDLRGLLPQPTAGHPTEYVFRGVQHTIVFKVQYCPGTNDLVTVWLDPKLNAGAMEDNQDTNLITHFTANAAFDEIHLRHVGGGGGWIFSDMAIATSFNDFVGASPVQDANVVERENGGPPYEFKSWQREQGLPQESVRVLAQDQQGYIWIGTDAGLVRFDGVHFVTFGVADGLPPGGVSALQVDQTGAVWVGTENGGLACWQNGRFHTLTKQDGLPSDTITALAEDDQGRIWIGTERGLVIWQNGKLRSLFSEFAGKAIGALFVDRQGVVWVAAADAGIFRCIGDKVALFGSKADNKRLQQTHCLLLDAKGRLWAGVGNDYILCHDGGRWIPYHLPRWPASSQATAFAEGPNGAIWAGLTGGLLRFQKGVPQIINANSGLSDNFIESLLIDRRENLWVGTKYGLNELKRGNLFAFGSREGLGDGAVEGLAEVAPGMVWIGKADDGLFRWDGTNINQVANHGRFQGNPQVRAVLAAKDGSCWVAGAHGLWQFTNTTEAEAGTMQLSDQVINALCKGSNNEIWAGTRDGKLWRLRDRQWILQTNYTRPVVCLLNGHDGTMWIGTDGAGLFQWEHQSQLHYGKASGLLSDSIRALHLDESGVLWIGTAGGGLSRLSKGHMTTFTTREGLPDNTVSQILEDDSGRLWLGTDRGIAAIARRELEECAAGKITTMNPQLYGHEDGMLSEECTGGFSPAGLKTRSGLLCFSTDRGLVVIDPHTANQAAGPTPNVFIEELIVDSAVQPLKPNGSSNGTNGTEASDSPLRLTAGSHSLEFKYTGLNFAEPARIHFRYQLEGLDRGWIEVGTQRAAVYNYVPPGSYRFRLQACGADGVWTESNSNLAFIVPRHFWQNWWFAAAAVVVSLAVVALAVRRIEKRRMQRRVQQLEQERALERERTRIAQDLHDEMGAKLCRISYLSEHLAHNNIQPPALREPVAFISEASREVLQAMDHIVWAVDPRNDNLANLPGYLGQVAQEYFEVTGIECEINIPAPLPSYPLSAHVRHHLLLAVGEALTNVLKHSQATHVTVRMARENSTFQIIIADNGIGFDPSARHANPATTGKTGNGLDNMCQRMDKIQGHCRIESAVGRGTILQFIIPLKPIDS